MNEINIENRGLDQRIFNFICNGYSIQACHLTLGFKITYLDQGKAGMEMRPNTKFTTQGGRLHGGIIATLADTVMGAAVSTISGKVYRTVEINMNYLAAVSDEDEIIAEACVIHPGNTIAVVEGSIFSKERQLVAKSRGTFIRDIKFKPDWEI